MKVQIKLFGNFRKYSPEENGESSFWMKFEEGSRLEVILNRLGIPDKEPKTLVCNHRAGKKEQLLNDGDVIAIFAPVAGG